jgi:uncharacterized membrane protein YcjF (UPF0283 family)
MDTAVSLTAPAIGRSDSRKGNDMREIKWYYILFMGLGLVAIIAIVYMVLRTTNILAKLTQRENNVIQTVD